jgi:hypothetical protein
MTPWSTLTCVTTDYMLQARRDMITPCRKTCPPLPEPTPPPVP